MTREEQIIKAAKDNGRYDWIHFQAFKEGANWADNHSIDISKLSDEELKDYANKCDNSLIEANRELYKRGI